MSSFLNKITKKDLLTYFEVDEQLLSKDVIDFLDKLFPIEYNELNFEEYQEYMTLVLQILNKLSFEIDFDRVKNKELPSFKISRFPSRISEKINNSKTLFKSVNFKTA